LPVIFEQNKADFLCFNLFFKGIQLFASLGFGAIVGDYCEKSKEIAAKKNQKNEINFRSAHRVNQNTNMSRIMAFDYGTKRIGIAITDPLQIIATGLQTVHPKDILDYLKKYMETESVECFVVGEPKQMDGSPSQSAVHVKGFIASLKKHFPAIPIDIVDERFTSKMASATITQSGLKKMDRQSKDRIDTISATIILQSYLEKKANSF